MESYNFVGVNEWNDLYETGRAIIAETKITTEKLENVLSRVDDLPDLDDRPADEILGYDEHGLPH